MDRPGFRNALCAACPGSSLVVLNIDRLGRNISELIQTVGLLQKRGLELVSLSQKIDTSTEPGKLVFDVLGMLGRVERDMLTDRKKAAFAERKRQGQKLGRKKTLEPGTKLWDQVVVKVQNGESFVKIADQFDGLSKSTLYNNAEELRADAAILEANALSAENGGNG